MPTGDIARSGSSASWITDIYTLSVALPKAQPQVGMCVLGIYFRYPGSEPPRGGAQLLPGFCQRQATGALVLTPSPCLVLTLGSGWALGAHLLTNFTALRLPRGVSRFWIRTEEPDRYLLRPRVVTALMCANEQISHALWQTDLHHPLDLVFYPFKIYFLLEHNSLKFTRVCNSVFKKKKKTHSQCTVIITTIKFPEFFIIHRKKSLYPLSTHSLNPSHILITARQPQISLLSLPASSGCFR